jgi:hypothetical protein
LGLTTKFHDGSINRNVMSPGIMPLVWLPFVFQYDAVYAAGGEDVKDALLALDFFRNEDIQGVLFMPLSSYQFVYDATTGKILAKVPDNVQAAHGHNLTQTTLTVALHAAFIKAKGAERTSAENADAAAEPTNGHAVAAQSAVAAGAWDHGALTNPDYGRSVCVVIENDSGGPLDLFEGVMTFHVVGTWKGAAQSEDITITSTGANKTVADTKWRYKYGIKPFDTVTDITLDNVPADGLKIGLGLGANFGIRNALAGDNALHCSVNGVYVDPAARLYHQGEVAQIPDFADDSDIVVEYESPAVVTNEAIVNTNTDPTVSMVEVPDGTDLTALEIPGIAWGN